MPNVESQVEENVLNWNERLSSQIVSIPSSGIRVFFDIVAQKKDVISLGVGEPDFVTPQIIVNTAIESLRNGYTHYTGNAGIPSLRNEISNYLKNAYNVDYNPDTEIMITVGVSQGIDIALRSIINPGDGIIYGSPSYVSYSPMIKLAGGIPKTISTKFSENFILKPDEIDNACDSQTKAILLNYPSNPTGSSYQKKDVEKIADAVIKNDLLVVSDEIYADLSYDFAHTAISSFPGMKERTILLGGFSKNFAMTGWRIGFAAGPKEWIKAMLKIHQYSMLCAPTVAQMAAETALKYALHERDKMRDSYARRREFIVTEFNRIGLETLNPDGAFYTFSRIEKTGLTSMEFAQTLLEQENVAVIPGDAFGEEGNGFIRCCYATSIDNIKIAMQRIDRFVNKI
ncbi:MAG: aminotransferase class I/II-fold pyridoxal phosphate-dependent enzyme [Spirochaetia bacterium]|nr:aminotransferase class I/II-fold pyridoxal phosphate-dependent enzyme [Spirochaetia bacterium]